jgi:hypothetical protein
MNADPSGKHLEFRGESDDEDDYKKAVNYLKDSTTAGNLIDYLTESKTHFVIQAEMNTMNKDKEHFAMADEFDPKNATIFWIPRGGKKWQDTLKSPWQYMSPALLLAHEMGHARAWDQATDKDAWAKIANSWTDETWKNSEERRDVQEVENVIARELNAHGAKEGIRTWYLTPKNAKNLQFITKSSVSMEPAVSFQIER